MEPRARWRHPETLEHVQSLSSSQVKVQIQIFLESKLQDSSSLESVNSSLAQSADEIWQNKD